MSADAVTYCLERLTDHREFERFCSALMSGVGYPTIEPLGGSSDRGRDALFRAGPDGELTIFAYSLRVDWKTKLWEDCARIHEMGHGPNAITFVSTASITTLHKDAARRDIKAEFGWSLDIYDLERIRIQLVGPQQPLVATHPSIFVPPFFQRKGGVPITLARNLVLIDHHPADHALATWLEKRLTLIGFDVWCHGTAPLAGENVEETIQVLLEQRAAVFLPIMSPESLANPDLVARCSTAARRDDCLVACWAADVSDIPIASKVAALDPIRFDRSWSAGLGSVHAALKNRGVVLPLNVDQARATALRSYIPKPLVLPEPEPIVANVFSAEVPKVIVGFKLKRALTDDEIAGMRRFWAFAILNETAVASWHAPSAWPALDFVEETLRFPIEKYERVADRPTHHVVRELIRRSMDLACVKAGLTWCADRKVYHFVGREGERSRLEFLHLDDRKTFVAAVGTKKFGFGDRASRFHYQLSPKFSAGSDEGGRWWVTLRLYVRVTDSNGVPFQGKTINSRRKAVTKSWWNKEWLARVLAVMQALATSQDKHQICIGSREANVRVSTRPMAWQCPVGLDVLALEHLDDLQEELSALLDTEQQDDDSSENAEVSDDDEEERQE